MHTSRSAAIAAGLATALSACSIDDLAPASRARVSKLEDRLEQRLEQLEAKFAAQEASAQAEAAAIRIRAEERKGLLRACLEIAEEEYWSLIKLNGRENPRRPGVWRAAEHIWKKAAEDKRNAIERCRVLYGEPDR